MLFLKCIVMVHSNIFIYFCPLFCCLWCVNFFFRVIYADTASPKMNKYVKIHASKYSSYTLALLGQKLINCLLIRHQIKYPYNFFLFFFVRSLNLTRYNYTNVYHTAILYLRNMIICFSLLFLLSKIGNSH